MVSLDGPPRSGTLENAVDVVTYFQVGLLYFLWKEEAMVVMFLLAALGASIPQADINRICESAKVDSLPEDRVTAMRGCVGDETSARDQLRREWGHYSAGDKNNCASTPGMQFSYVELLTCLEMQRGGNFGGGSSLAAPSTRPTTPPATPEPKP